MKLEHFRTLSLLLPVAANIFDDKSISHFMFTQFFSLCDKTNDHFLRNDKFYNILNDSVVKIYFIMN